MRLPPSSRRRARAELDCYRSEGNAEGVRDPTHDFFLLRGAASCCMVLHGDVRCGMMMQRVTVSLRDDVWAALDRRASRDRRSRSATVALLVESALDGAGGARSSGTPRSAGVSGVTEAALAPGGAHVPAPSRAALEEGEPGGAAGFVPVGATPATQAESDASGAVSELAPSPSSSPRPLDLACPMDVPRGVFCKVCGKRH